MSARVPATIALQHARSDVLDPDSGAKGYTCLVRRAGFTEVSSGVLWNV